MQASDNLEVFRHALSGIVEETGLTLQRTAYSTNIKTRRDFTCALFDNHLRHTAMHDIAPHHIGSVAMVVPKVMEQWEDELEPGDGVLFNDPSLGTIHLPDVFLISPLFYDGEIMGYAANIAHHVDTGGSTPGGMGTDSTDLYSEGLIIPDIKAVTDWEFDPNIFKLITRNIRVAKIREGDSRAQLAANKTGEERYRDLIDTYGREAVNEKIDDLLDYSERRVRAGFADLPDGVYEAEDLLDGDGVVDEPVRLKLSVTVDHDEVTIDFTGTADQNEGPLNAPPSLPFGGVMTVLMSIIGGGDIPKNDGIYRPFEFITPKGTMVNPGPNAPVAGVGEISMRACELVIKALSDVAPERTIAGSKGVVVNTAFGGTDPRTDEDYVYYEALAGGYGGRPTKDGMDAVQPHFQNTANSPIEEIESDVPVRIRRYELIQDSEGAGRYRGGLGIRRDYQFYDHSASFSVLSDRTKTQPWGLFGGNPARSAQFVINPDSDNPQSVKSKSTTSLQPGDTMSMQTPGGGGYRDPHERPPEEVLWDVVNGKVSEENARKEYGVVVDLESRSVDEEATAALRTPTTTTPSNGESTE